MEVVKLKDLYNVDTISQDKGWKKVHDNLPADTNIMIDFTDINTVEPWTCVEFTKLLRETNIHLRFTNNEVVVNRIKALCIIENMNPDRVENVVVELPKEETMEEKKIKKLGSELKSRFTIENGTASFVVAGNYDQLHSTNTLNNIKYAIDLLIEDEIKHVMLDLRGVSVLRNVTEIIADMIVNYSKMGVVLEVNIEDPETINDLKLFIHMATNKAYNDKEKYKMVLDRFKVGTAGILIKYKKSKALDEFGRHGSGEIISSRIAIIEGFSIEDGKDSIVIRSFNNNYFYTKQQWMIEHDGDIPTDLKSDRLTISIDQIGFCDMFLGTDYHFLLPVQQSPSESMVLIKEIDDDGHNVRVKCTIPERIKLVFDDWDINYDKESLEESIKDTKEVLGIE